MLRNIHFRSLCFNIVTFKVNKLILEGKLKGIKSLPLKWSSITLIWRS